MKALLFVLALACAPVFAHDKSEPPDNGLAVTNNDKADHAIVSGLFGFAARMQFPDQPLKAWGVAMIPGVVKELLDATQKGNRFDAKDLAADALGAALGVSLGGLAIHLRRDEIRVSYNLTF